MHGKSRQGARAFIVPAITPAKRRRHANREETIITFCGEPRVHGDL